MKKIQILLAEDEEHMGELLREYLVLKNYLVDWYVNGEQVSKYFSAKRYDLCILDVMMPKKDGFTVAKEIRKKNTYIPIIFLTAKTMHEDLMEGFASGADDYIAKPFNLEELSLRIEAILRRTKNVRVELSPEKLFQLGSLLFDFEKQTLTNDDKTVNISLTNKEAELLRLLCIHKNKVLDRHFALSTVWKEENYFNARSMDVYITRLRKYISADPSVTIINERGKGFKLVS
ncbi:MAG: response regulator transcription factor [Prevotellaceae bacterium]|jgi:DNA-binding response OmpR family regulator|nr:response regulator transcription factor [Prevotellaceae bacterium]